MSNRLFYIPKKMYMLSTYISTALNCHKFVPGISRRVNMDKFLGPNHFKDQADSQHKYYQKSTQFAKMSKISLIPKSS
uniref:Uncharacterized protein n=1 Tax=Solanum tuberosum TaxID=4113 RepID=M1CXM4_SOLTU